VDALLESDRRTSDGLSRVADELTAALPDESPNIGRRIGPYRITRLLGAGGMGVVYLAERVGDFSQQVALKLIRPGMASRAVVSRFRSERQILAVLEHPNIARLLDGGATEDGQPYLVMEYVDGVPITVHATDRALTLRDRLLLFRKICAAVHHAHQNLIVHRDIKPANILVTADGAPKLMDFGIAKLLGDAAADEAAPATQTGWRAMTPEYASPEQVRGLPMTTATDVYSLGIVLYELLTEQRPYAFATDTPSDVERIIVETEPRPPSAVAPPSLSRALAGDLDTIVLKALDKDASRRYDSVDRLSADVQRHLDGAPILARPQTFGYRASRFIRRHRLAVGAAALVFMSLVVGLGAAVWQQRIASRERQRADRRFNDVRALAHAFVFDFHDAI
jgi:serine/threonine protein kinase